jgi:hypothetical protein
MGADIRAQAAWEDAQKAIREADRAEAEAWLVSMESYGRPAQRSANASTATRMMRIMSQDA